MDAREIEKMTVVKLREECLKIPNMVGVHGMSKSQLIKELKEFNKIPIDIPRRPKTDVKKLKKNIVQLRQELDASRTDKNKKRVKYLQGRISSLKKKTRRS